MKTDRLCEPVSLFVTICCDNMTSGSQHIIDWAPIYATEKQLFVVIKWITKLH